MNPACRDCAEPVRWERTERGRKVRLNPQPDRLGSVALIPTSLGTVARILTGGELAGWRGQLWMPHWATCAHNGRGVRGAQRAGT